MSRPERLLLLGFFAVLLVLLGSQELAPTAVGAAAGAVPGLAVAGRLGRLSSRMDTRLGIVEERPRGVRPRRLLVRGGLHLGLLAVIWLSTVVVPFVGDEISAASAAGVTAMAGALTAARLRR